jgi:hypothetical protein
MRPDRPVCSPDRTRVALAARKAQGVRLVNPVNLGEASAKGAAT